MAFEHFKKPEDKAQTETKNWYSDRYQTAIVQRNILFVAAMVSLLGLLGTIFLIYTRIPLVAVEPFAIEIDKRAGLVQAVAPLDSGLFEKDKAVTNYFLVQYLRAWQTINIGDFSYNANLIRLMSNPDVFRKYIREANPLDPNTAAGRLGQAGKRDVKIKSMYFPSPGTAQIHFYVETGNRVGEVQTTEHFMATVKYEFRKVDLQFEEAFFNPVGFYVSDYSLIKESQ